MVHKLTYSKPETLDFGAEGVTQKQIAGPCELGYIKLAASASAAVVKVYDGTSSADVNNQQLKWVLDASTTDTDGDGFAYPLEFIRGIFVVLEQGAGAGAILSYAVVLPHHTED